ncbi:hypothetical protein DVH24_032577 [Malus domestica]|uniref:Uncharacterized protein n=1 Tax=Malus domestica TaxID=3750 RepID=A0A498J403_MALDO|nr:hypothetical protein DVH24_032577 [Malus domestica]
MDIDLRLPSGEHGKEDEEPHEIDNLLEHEEKVHNGDIASENIEDVRDEVNSEPEVMAVGAQDSLQPMEKLNSRAVTLDGYYAAQPNVQGMVQLNLMAPTRDNYYGNQQTIQGLGQLNSIAPSHDGYYSAQQSMHGLGQMDFFRTPTGYAYGIRLTVVFSLCQDDPNVRTAPLHEDASRHA